MKLGLDNKRIVFKILYTWKLKSVLLNTPLGKVEIAGKNMKHIKLNKMKAPYIKICRTQLNHFFE